MQDAIDEGSREETGKYSSRNSLQTTTLLDAIEEFKFVLVVHVEMKKSKS
jgi:sulfate adenylyltransferase subunit 2